MPPENLPTPESADNYGEQRRITETEAALQQYREAVLKSNLPEADKKQCISMLDSKPASQHKLELLQSNLKYLPEAERMAQQQSKTYEEMLDKAANEGLFSKNPQTRKEYMDWFGSMPFDEREKIKKQPLYKLDDRKKAAGDWERIPEAERKIHQAQWDKLGVEERLIKATALRKRHETLKAEFLKLPRELQGKYKEQFKHKTLDERDALLSAIAKEKRPAKTSSKETAEQKEAVKLDTAFAVKTEKMVRDNLLAPDSKAKHDTWFAALPVIRKRYMMNHSDLDTRMKERKDTLKAFNKLPPEIRAQHDLRFRNYDLDKRQELMASMDGLRQAQPDTARPDVKQKKDGFIKNILRKIFASSAHRDVRAELETFAVTNEIAERRHRFRLTHHTREESAAKADNKGLDRTAQDSQKLAQETHLKELHESDGGVKVKLDVLESHAEARHKWRRFLKPRIADVNAKLASDITLRTKSGEEIIDEKAYQRGELGRELDAIKRKVNPIIETEAHAAGLNLTQKEIADKLEKEDIQKYGKETIERAA